MRELRQPTLLSVFFVCIYSCPVSVLFGIGNAIGSSAIIRQKGQAASKPYVLEYLEFYNFLCIVLSSKEEISLRNNRGRARTATTKKLGRSRQATLLRTNYSTQQRSTEPRRVIGSK